MFKKVKVNILRAFVDEKGRYGNPTGIIVDEDQKLSVGQRQKIAAKLKFTDTVFIDNLKTANVSFFNPQQETKFAGDALISTSYFMNYVLRKDVKFLVCKGGLIKTWMEGELIWIEASLEGTPAWNHKQVLDPNVVKDISPKEASKFKHTMIWAWVDEKKGIISSRTFLLDWGTLEDQGNGSGSMQLSTRLNREIEIHQGQGSVIFAIPSGINFARVGGRVVLDESRIILS